MARGKPQLNGAPAPSATSRPAGKGGIEDAPGGPNRFKGQTKALRESSGTTRSTGPGHRQPLASQRMAGEGIAPNLTDAWKMSGDKSIGGGPPRASSKTDARANVKVNEQGNRHGAADIAGAPPLAR